MSFVFGCMVGAFLGAIIMGIVSVNKYSKLEKEYIKLKYKTND